MQDNSLIVRIHDASQQSYGLNKLVGNVGLAAFVDLITIADLDANPRQAKKSMVTDDIEESLETEPDIFHFMTKGVLIGARRVETLERDRYRITFEDPQLEGILDGGHNTFANGRFIVRTLLDDGEAIAKKIRRWDDLRTVWQDHRETIELRKKDLPDVRIPVEVIFPATGDGAEEYFQEKILRINAARNNNAQLTEETKTNKRGGYDEIKKNLDPQIEVDVEWKANAGGRLKARDLIALSLIPLSVLPDDLPTAAIRKNPTIIFSQKGQCVQLFDDLLETDGVAESVKGDIVEITHPSIQSALKMMKDIPRLYDLVYARLPDAYNKVSSRFGGMSCVRLWNGTDKHKENKKKYLAKPASTKFYQKDVEYDYPDGFVYPIVYALSALMEFKDGELSWKTAPDAFIIANLEKVMRTYWTIIQGQGYDPAKVGKATGAYALVQTLFESALNENLIAQLKATNQI